MTAPASPPLGGTRRRRTCVEGTAYEVEPELAGETVTLLWDLFDQELYVGYGGSRRFGPFQPSRGLGNPDADRLRGRLELAGKVLWRRTSSTV